MMTTWRLTLIGTCAALCLTIPAVADEFTSTVRVKNPGPARSVVPLRAWVRVPKSLAEVTDCQLVGPDGGITPGQLAKPSLLAMAPPSNDDGHLWRELHFVLPELAQDDERTYELRISSEQSAEAPRYRWTIEENNWAELALGERPVMRYMFEPLDESSRERRDETYKVYHHVYDPSGRRFVTKGTGGLFPHHRGVFFGFNEISYDGKRADVWHCRNGESQQHRAFLEASVGPVLGRHQVEIDWNGRDGQTFAKERRELTSFAVPGGVLLEFTSLLETRTGPVKLDGDPQHAGFQFRASQDVPDKTSALTYYLRPDGRGEPGQFRNWPGDANHVNLPWNALSFVLDDQRYTCCYLDHPDNPKPSRYSERDYGRFGSYFEYTLEADRPLRIAYRLWLQEGEMDVAEVENHHRNFVSPPEVTVGATAVESR